MKDFWAEQMDEIKNPELNKKRLLITIIVIFIIVISIIIIGLYNTNNKAREWIDINI